MPITICSRSAHDATNPRERIPDITATGVNTIGSISLALDPATLRHPVAARPLLSGVLPPLVFGTATFNHQFNKDPYALQPNTIVQHALASGIRAFDTSPYYGPAETILGGALHSELVSNDQQLQHLTREDYLLLTKCGRIAGNEFDYSPEWIRFSVRRSLRRLKTTYLDVVYLHDVEFVSPAEVLTGIRTLRQIRDESRTIRYVGICGYPVDILADLAELVKLETGESLDIVQSYANYTIQNQQLLDRGLSRFLNAGVDVVPNASPLGMGLLRSVGVPLGDSNGSWHPAPDELRHACLKAAQHVEQERNEKLESLAVRFAMQSWCDKGSLVGSSGSTPREAISALMKRSEGSTKKGDCVATHGEQAHSGRPRLGVSVMGVSKLSELEGTMSVYNSILDSDRFTSECSDGSQEQVEDIAQYIREHILGIDWTDHAWASPDPGFVNQRKHFGGSDEEQDSDSAEANASGDLFVPEGPSANETKEATLVFPTNAEGMSKMKSQAEVAGISNMT